MPFHIKLLVAILLCSTATQAQSVTSLFNGNDLEGWHAFEPKTGKHTDATDLFLVEEHMIRLSGNKIGYLMSEESFKDFKLTVEFRWNTDTTFVRKSNKMNSGLMYLIPTEIPDMLWPQGIQFQIKKGATGDFICLNKTTIEIKKIRTEPGKSVVSKRFKDATHPIGEWNTIVVESKDNIIVQKLNGEIVNKGTNPSVTEGRILLQYEGFPIDFRKVEIEKYN